MRKTSQKSKSKYKGSIFALSMYFHYTNYTHRIQNVISGLIFGRIIGLTYRGADIHNFTVSLYWHVNFRSIKLSLFAEYSKRLTKGA